jgi:hypothetical protein
VIIDQMRGRPRPVEGCIVVIMAEEELPQDHLLLRLCLILVMRLSGYMIGSFVSNSDAAFVVGKLRQS